MLIYRDNINQSFQLHVGPQYIRRLIYIYIQFHPELLFLPVENLELYHQNRISVPFLAQIACLQYSNLTMQPFYRRIILPYIIDRMLSRAAEMSIVLQDLLARYQSHDAESETHRSLSLNLMFVIYIFLISTFFLNATIIYLKNFHDIFSFMHKSSFTWNHGKVERLSLAVRISPWWCARPMKY